MILWGTSSGKVVASLYIKREHGVKVATQYEYEEDEELLEDDDELELLANDSLILLVGDLLRLLSA